MRLSRILPALVIVFFVSCGTASRSRVPPGFIVSIAHSSAGIAPISTMAFIYDDGRIVIRSSRGSVRSEMLSAAEASRIEVLLADEQLKSELIHLSKLSAPFFDHEELSITLDGEDHRIVCGEVEPTVAVSRIINTIEKIVSNEFGKRLSVRVSCG